MNCNGCGVELSPSEEQVNTAVDQILETSLKHAQKTGGVCPLCGHSKELPYSQRKSVLFALLAVCLVLLATGAVVLRQWLQTERASVVSAAINRMSSNADVIRFIGAPITADKKMVAGDIRHDETGWREARLVIPVHGPHGEGRVHVIAGRGSDAWVFTTFEVV